MSRVHAPALTSRWVFFGLAALTLLMFALLNQGVARHLRD